MSTTVTYKGSTIATVENQTKTLTTAGTWLEGNIILTDVTSGGTAAISVVDTSDSHGGTIRTITALDISDTTAIASDVAQGKYFYTADGTKTLGTASGGSSTAADFLLALITNSTDLRSFTELPVSPTSIGYYEFYNKSNLALTSLPDSITTISESAFCNCAYLALTSLPSGLTRIGNWAFSGCGNLAISALPSGITKISEGTFGDCPGITTFTIPASVTQIGSYAFYNCTGMTEYHFLGTTPPTLSSEYAFLNIPSNCKIYVPSESLAAYQSASNWSTYADYMVGE